ncbi:MAG: hypothetical protein OMM_07448 [Candidatus Magnetoglobus multicellularis str. Araruama]|uniref:POTRA domain-containing protein n=1 Tax=Candidatus Magnetoglobus multicellularis str. Araruama TaxID=890399 RepID=A0A1V1PCZ4_9BACT|nr:MAG: hypothetical protein OMM_07448 [Candidatus Magnetoglobus multicellularis str. Araruama]
MYNQATYKAYDRKKSIHFKGTLIFTIIISVLSILCIFVYDCLTAMPYFQTQDIQIRGHNYLSKAQILECGGLMPGDNIIDLNISQINKRLVQNPWIASASTYRQFPNALHIEITEKKPLAILMIAPPVIIDTYGRVIKNRHHQIQITCQWSQALHMPIFHSQVRLYHKK